MVRVPTTITYSTEYGTIPDETLNAVAYSGESYDEIHLPGLTADGYLFCGWYSTSTFDEGTLVSVGDAIPSHGIIYAKWERITVATIFTNLADEIRVLSGTTEPLGLDEMATNVSDANDEVADQTELLAQLANALQGKSVEGGGSAAVETCTVILEGSDTPYRPYYYTYTTVDGNGNVVGTAVGNNVQTKVTLNNVVCGTVVTVDWHSFGTYEIKDNATLLTNEGRYFHALLIEAPAGGTATLQNKGGGSN